MGKVTDFGADLGEREPDERVGDRVAVGIDDLERDVLARWQGEGAQLEIRAHRQRREERGARGALARPGSPAEARHEDAQTDLAGRNIAQHELAVLVNGRARGAVRRTVHRVVHRHELRRRPIRVHHPPRHREAPNRGAEHDVQLSIRNDLDTEQRARLGAGGLDLHVVGAVRHDDGVVATGTGRRRGDRGPGLLELDQGAGDRSCPRKGHGSCDRRRSTVRDELGFRLLQGRLDETAAPTTCRWRSGAARDHQHHRRNGTCPDRRPHRVPPSHKRRRIIFRAGSCSRRKQLLSVNRTGPGHAADRPPPPHV